MYTPILPGRLCSLIGLLIAGATVGACSEDSASDRITSPAPAQLQMTVVSSQSWLVTGGDALIQIDSAEGVDLDTAVFLIDGLEMAADLRQDDSGRALALLSGLPDGEVRIETRTGDQQARAELRNHPSTGPLISGPHQQPFLCQTEEFRTATGVSLGPPVDEHCSVATRRDYVYLSSDSGEFLPWPQSGDRPGDIAETVTVDGRTVPMIALVETGTLNRAVYEIALLHDPAQPQPDAWNRASGWNGRLVYTHGGGCRAGWHQQGDRSGGVLNAGLLGMGFAVTSSSLNVFGQNCNDLLASETHMMVKERFIEQFGIPQYTIATGASGGSYQSHQTADNYPGVFDGIIVSASFPDVTSATIFTLADARLLHHFFTSLAPELFSREQQLAVSGFGQWGSIPNLSQGAARLDPTFDPEALPEQQGGEVSLPALEDMRYQPANPEGIRATVYDHTRNVYGVDPATGFARRPLDNYGVQYGLRALNEGMISTEQFLALNENIGGFDIDLNHVTERHRADPEAARSAISSGRILFGGAGLAHTPVIDYRSYTDDVEGGDIHMIVHQHSTRARMLAANGHVDNHVMAVGGRWGFTDERPDLKELFLQMDEWLSSGIRPPSLTDHCWDNTAQTRVRIEETLEATGSGQCARLYPVFSTPRHVAGAPLANDIVSCTLKPVDPADYSVTLEEEQLRRLRRIFPEGVCDWSAADSHGAEYGGTWQSFGPAWSGEGRPAP